MKITTGGINLRPGRGHIGNHKVREQFFWLGLEDDDNMQEQLEKDDSDVAKAKRVTDIMAADLTYHYFELNFSENIVCAPVLYGGRASGGNILCVLSMRVWT